MDSIVHITQQMTAAKRAQVSKILAAMDSGNAVENSNGDSASWSECWNEESSRLSQHVNLITGGYWSAAVIDVQRRNTMISENALVEYTRTVSLHWRQ